VKTFSRVGTARALVLLAAALAVGGAALLCLLVVVFVDRIALAAVAFLGFALVSAVVSTLLTVRARTTPKVVGFGCGVLLVGMVVGLAVMLIMITRLAGGPE
jgi:hypothetical protein